MTLKEIFEQCSILNVMDERCISDDYVWLVFSNEEAQKWNELFADILGPAIKPAGVTPSQEDLVLTKDYGGIRKDQTLFKKEFDDYTVIAMFWPWQDKVRTTLKMVLFKR